MPMEVWTRRDIASVTPKKRLCDAYVSDKGGRSDFWLSSRRLTCQSLTIDDVHIAFDASPQEYIPVVSRSFDRVTLG
jgi:hypothetical protein